MLPPFTSIIGQPRRPVKGEAPIFTFDGRRQVCVGTYDAAERCFIKPLRPEHLLRKPPAIALQASVLAELEGLGCRLLQAHLWDGRILEASLETFRRFSLRLNRGHGEQLALPLSRWRERGDSQGLLFPEGVPA